MIKDLKYNRILEGKHKGKKARVIKTEEATYFFFKDKTTAKEPADYMPKMKRGCGCGFPFKIRLKNATKMLNGFRLS